MWVSLEVLESTPLGHLGYHVVHYCFHLICSGYNLFCSNLGKGTLTGNNAKTNKTGFLFWSNFTRGKHTWIYSVEAVQHYCWSQHRAYEPGFENFHFLLKMFKPSLNYLRFRIWFFMSEKWGSNIYQTGFKAKKKKKAWCCKVPLKV